MIYPWLQNSYRQVNQLLLKGHLPHALLFHGGVGLGKQHLTLHLAQLILCDDPISSTDGEQPCGQCRSCTLISADTHPDLFLLSAQDETISVESIRSITSWAQAHSARAGFKVILLGKIERMTTAAANALLKVLEEPPGNTCFLLSSSHLSALLPTIKSRCQLWRLDASVDHLGQRYLQKHLQNQGVSPQQIQAALALAGGSPLQALELLKTGELGQLECLIVLFRQWLSQSETTEVLLKELIKQPRLFELLLCDLLKSKMGVSPQYYSAPSYKEQLKMISKQVSAESLHQAHKAFLDLNQAVKLSSGINQPLSLTAILLTLKQNGERTC